MHAKEYKFIDKGVNFLKIWFSFFLGILHIQPTL